MRGLQGDEADLLAPAEGGLGGGTLKDDFLRRVQVPRGAVQAGGVSTAQGTRGDRRFQIKVTPALDGGQRHSHWGRKLLLTSCLQGLDVGLKLACTVLVMTLGQRLLSSLV